MKADIEKLRQFTEDVDTAVGEDKTLSTEDQERFLKEVQAMDDATASLAAEHLALFLNEEVASSAPETE
jgi:hypothetical protein